MKKILVPALAVAIALSPCLGGCSSSSPEAEAEQAQEQEAVEQTADPEDEKAEEQAAEYIAVVQKGLQERWAIVDQDAATFGESAEQLKSGVAAELAQLRSVDPDELVDEGLATLAKRYIAALEAQTEGAEFQLTEPAKYQELYIEKGADGRAEVLRTLKSDYGLTVDSQYSDNLNDAMTESTVSFVNPGTPVTVSTSYGDLEVTVESFAINQEHTASAREDGQAGETNSIGVLRLGVKNVSYGGYQDDYISIYTDIFPAGPDGYSFPTLNSDYDYPGYDSGLGGFFPLVQGQAKRVAVPYVVSSVPDYAVVQIGSGAVTYVPVLQE